MKETISKSSNFISGQPGIFLPGLYSIFYLLFLSFTAIFNNIFQVCHKANVLIFDVRDKDHAYTEEIGKVCIIFTVWLRNRLIFAGLKLVLSHTEIYVVCIASYYRQFSTNVEIKILKLKPVFLDRAFGYAGLRQSSIFLF